jgi:16S rRNA (guanine527-N7)-methyltransferase
MDLSSSSSDAEQWERWQQHCQAQGVSVSLQQQQQLKHYYTLIEAHNRVISLTSMHGLQDFLYRHLLDCLVLLPHFPVLYTLADVGSGAGLPAIPIAIMQPACLVTAIESVGKKARFLETVQQHLQLNHFSVLNQRSEAVAKIPEHREQYDIVTARAVASLGSLLELCLPLVKVNGLFFAMKGRQFQQELDACNKALKLLNATLVKVITFDTPMLQGSNILVFQKTARIPARFPRKPGDALKHPLV